MYKSISSLFEKMGNWYGIVFKLIIPFFVMYRPIKAFIFSFVLMVTAGGGNIFSSSDMGLFMFIILYAVFVLLLFLLPKVASAIEFVFITWYFVFLIVFAILNFGGGSSANIWHILSTYSRELPWVIIFLSGKIFVFFFVRSNSKEYEKAQEFKNRTKLHS